MAGRRWLALVGSFAPGDMRRGLLKAPLDPAAAFDLTHHGRSVEAIPDYMDYAPDAMDREPDDPEEDDDGF